MKIRIPVFIVYTLCNFLMLLNKGVFWDDWTVFNMEWEGIRQQWSHNGMFFPMYIYNFLNQLPMPVFWYHLTSFLLGLAIVHSFMELVRKLDVLTSAQLMMLGMIVAATPLYHTRILLISIQYVLCLLSFLIGANFLLRYIAGGSVIYRIAALALFFFSFIISSMVVFYVAPLLLFVLRKNLRTAKDWAMHADLFLLPVVFWAFKSKFLAPGGLHAMEGYNKVTVSGLIQAPAGLLESFKLSMFAMLTLMAETLTKNFAMLVILLTAGGVFLIRSVEARLRPEATAPLRWGRFSISPMAAFLVAGIVLYVVGAFAYVVVGKIPMFNNFNARNQLLLPFGTAMVLLGATEIIVHARYRKVVYAFILASSLVINVQMFLNYQKDSFRQSAIMENLKDQDLTDHHTILVTDSTMKYVETETSQVVYSGMTKFVTGEQTRLVISKAKAEAISEIYGSVDVLAIDGASLNIRDWKPAPFDTRLTLTNGPVDLSSMSTVAKLLVKSWTNPADFASSVKGAVQMRIEKI